MLPTGSSPSKIARGAKIACPNTAFIDHVIVAPQGPVGGQYYSFTESKLYAVPVPKQSRRKAPGAVPATGRPFTVAIRSQGTSKTYGPFATVTEAVNVLQAEPAASGAKGTVYNGAKLADYRGGKAVFVFGRTRWSRA